MRQIRGNLWDLPGDAVCITTNGAVKRNGACVMGRGCAREARDRFPGIDTRLGTLISTAGNHVHNLALYAGRSILSFPVKHQWHEDADFALIQRSAYELVALVDRHSDWETVLLPRPGCGNGHLSWTAVEPVLTHILDDRIAIVTF